MIRTLTAFLVALTLAACSGARKGESEPEPELPSRAGDTSQAFSLPGVPLKFMPPPEKGKTTPKKELLGEKPATAPAPAAPDPAAAPEPAAQPEAAAATAKDSGDLEYHLSSARKYAFKKKYRSAAAEYAAAVPFLPAGDARAVQLLERQGAMLLRAGAPDKAMAAFKSAIDKAGELKTAGGDLANAHLGLGYCYEQAKNVPEALKNYETALKLAPGKKTKAKISETIAALKK